jgi:hypothetical protein
MNRKHLIQFLLLGVLFLLQSCDPQIMDDRRILVKGNIVDSENNPVANIAVRCQTYGLVLGEARSDANGQFQFTSLDAESYNGLNIMVNMKSNDYYYEDGHSYDLTENPAYSAKQYFDNFTNRPAKTYNLGQIKLNDAAQLTVFFNNIPGDNNNVAYKMEYDSAICQIDLNVPNSEDCNYEEYNYYQQLDINTANFQTNIKSQLGSTVIFKYILNNEPEQTISIPLTNTENTYVFEY